MDKNFRIMFLRGSNNHPVGCIAMRLGGNSVAYQVSTLNPVDKFNRRVARQLALGRLLESPFLIQANASNIHETVRSVMQDISRNKSVSNRARICAARWINSAKQSTKFE